MDDAEAELGHEYRGAGPEAAKDRDEPEDGVWSCGHSAAQPGVSCPICDYHRVMAEARLRGKTARARDAAERTPGDERPAAPERRPPDSPEAKDGRGASSRTPTPPGSPPGATGDASLPRTTPPQTLPPSGPQWWLLSYVFCCSRSRHKRIFHTFFGHTKAFL